MNDSEWRPIETAPKDGTPVLVFCPYDENRPYGDEKARYREQFTTAFLDESGQWELCVYWGWDADPNPFEEPTHWLPLPSPPKTKE